MTKVKHTPLVNQLRKYRKARGLKQRDAARILGLADASSLSRWEQGVCLPSVTNMFRLAALYRTLVDALYIDTLRTIREEVRGREADLHPREDHDSTSTLIADFSRSQCKNPAFFARAFAVAKNIVPRKEA